MRFILSFLIALSFAIADYQISPSQLPQNAKNFLQEHFQMEATFAVRDSWEYEVMLSNGTKVEFTTNGTFKSAKGLSLPKSILPQSVRKVADTQFTNQPITEIEVEYYGYDLEFSGYIEVKVTSTGQILMQKID